MASLTEVPACLFAILTLVAADADAPRSACKPVQVERAGEQGPYRFSEAMWLRAWKEGAAGDALTVEQPRVFVTTSGHYYVPEESRRLGLLALRRNVPVAQLVAHGFARRNRDELARALRRMPTGGELYVAHRLGHELAARLVSLAAEKPDEPLLSALPEIEDRSAELAVAARNQKLTVVRALDRLLLEFETAGPGKTAKRTEPAKAGSAPLRLVHGLGAGLVAALHPRAEPALAETRWTAEVRLAAEQAP